MAVTTGLVHRVKLIPGNFRAWAYIGPAANDTTLLLVEAGDPDNPTEVAFRASMAEALSSALVSRRQVNATHGDNNATITQIEFVPE